MFSKRSFKFRQCKPCSFYELECYKLHEPLDMDITWIPEAFHSMAVLQALRVLLATFHLHQILWLHLTLAMPQ